MRKLLIVDDERNIRLGVKTMIERQYPGIFTVTLCRDGEEALQELEREKTDIIITDIRMPRMDGIVLMGRVAAMEQRPAVIILTGYEEFEYAKTAIQCSVKEYLLKPVVREELFQAIERVLAEINRQEQLEEKIGANEQLLQALRFNTLNYIFIHPDLSPEEVGTRCRSIGMDPWSEGYSIGILKQGERPGTRIQLDALKLELSCQLIRMADSDKQLVLIASHREFFDRLASRLFKDHRTIYSLGVSEWGTDLGQLKELYRQAKETVKYSFFHQDPVLISYESVKARKRNYTVPVDQVHKLAHMLGTDRIPEMKALLMSLLDIRKISEYDITYMESLAMALNEIVFDQAFRAYGEESIEIFRQYKHIGDMYQAAHLDEYYHQVENLLFRLNDYIKNITFAHSEHREMKQAVEFIMEHYGKDLNMAVVANHVSLNYSYFSQSFKEYTGSNFSDYLKKLRIDKAKLLLEKTEWKVYEISDRVGYKNPKHFNRAFKEITGITPVEYREKAVVSTQIR